MNFKIKYMRTDTGCLEIFINKGKKYIGSVIVFPDDTVWLDLGNEHKAPVHVYPFNALHRIWYKEYCKDCGWESEPFEGIPCGLGGILDCPECRKHKRNGPFVEGCYGNVCSIKLDWETKEPIICKYYKECANFIGHTDKCDKTPKTGENYFPECLAVEGIG